MHQGEALRDYIKSNGIEIKALSARMGLSQKALFAWFKRGVLSEKNVSQLEKVGIKKENLFSNETPKTTPDMKVEYERLKLENEYLKRENELLRQLSGQGKPAIERHSKAS
jgi:hypothetical protein